MSPVSCPSCGEKGNIPSQLIGKRIRCQKCSRSFVAGEVVGSTAPAQSDTPKAGGDTIEVDGLDAAAWAATEPHAHAKEADHAPPRDPSPAFAAHPESAPHDGPTRHYKVLTAKDRYFEGKFDLAKLEEALNHYAGQGWVVRAMATPHVTGFSGGPREELVILMER